MKPLRKNAPRWIIFEGAWADREQVANVNWHGRKRAPYPRLEDCLRINGQFFLVVGVAPCGKRDESFEIDIIPTTGRAIAKALGL